MADPEGLGDIAAEPALRRAVEDWRRWLADEKRCSDHTLESYSHDLARFLGFIAGHLGYPPGLGDLEGLSAADFRAYLAKRNSAGLARTSTARAMSSSHLVTSSFVVGATSRSALMTPDIEVSVAVKKPSIDARHLASVS
ncbi:MAG: site-specific integrase [Proteobacteria bacterium]|nr:site-specific integrase [Pseudomonadota bacterium]